MQDKIWIGAVNYLNTKPLLYGLEQGALGDLVELSGDYPARIASRLMEGSIDAGLVPVAVIPRLKQHYIIADYCIGCDGDVASVCLFSNEPIEELDTVILDYQSRSSVNLFRILLKEFWKLDIKLVNGGPGFEDRIEGKTGVILIGDRALKKRRHVNHIYDLGGAWKQHTGLPFVFAAWVANKPLPAEFVTTFNQTNAEGFNHLEEIVSKIDFPEYDLMKYYTRDIDYTLDERKMQGMKLFLEKLSLLPPADPGQ